MSRLIEKDKVWKVTYTISHAPHYTIELDSGHFVGVYAPVENVNKDTSIPFGKERKEVLEYQEQEHITINVMDKQNTPFSRNTFHEQIIPTNKVLKFKF